MTLGLTTTPTKRRIAHIVATTEGATWMVEQLRELRDRHGFDVKAIISGPEGGTVDKLRANGIPFAAADFEFSSLRDLVALPRKILALAALLRRERFDVVQTHLFHSMVIGRIAAWLADVPVRLAMVASPYHLEASTPRWIDGSTQWMETALIASCELTRKLYRGLGVAASRIELVYYGADEALFTPDTNDVADLRSEFGWSEGTPLVGMVAFFYPRLSASRFVPPYVHGEGFKGHEYLLKAVPLVLKEMGSARFVLVGSGWGPAGDVHLAEMKTLARDLGLSGKVAFAGLRHDVPRVLRALDVSVQPSVAENLGGTVESLLVACPTVGSRVGGIPDAIVDGVTGILVEPRDPSDLARAILALLRDRKRAQALGKAGRERMLQGFTLKSAAQALSDIYAQRLKDAPSGYRPTASALRAVVAVPVGVYLVLRLMFDMVILARTEPTGDVRSTLWRRVWGGLTHGALLLASIVAALPGPRAARETLQLFIRRLWQSLPESSNVFFLAAAQAVAVATSVGTVAVLARSLSGLVLGQLALAFYAVTTVSLLAQLGLRYTAVREIALEPGARRSIHHHAARAQWLASGLSLGLLLFVAARFWPGEVALLFEAGLVAVTQFDCDPATWVLLGEGRIPAVAGLLALDRILYFVAVCTTALLGGTVESVLLACLGANGLRKVISSRRLAMSLKGLPPPQWDPVLFRRLFMDGALLGAAVLSYAVYSQATFLLFGKWAATSELGYYSVAFSATSFLSIIPTSLTLALFPTLTSRYGGGEKGDLFDRTAALNCLVVVPLSMAGVMFGPEFLTYWFGLSSGLSPLVTKLLALSLVPSTLSFMHRLFFFVGDRPVPEIALNVSALTLTGIVALPFSRRGAVGAALLYLLTESGLACAKGMVNRSKVGGRLGGTLLARSVGFVGIAAALSLAHLSLVVRVLAYLALGGAFLASSASSWLPALSVSTRRKTDALSGE